MSWHRLGLLRPPPGFLAGVSVGTHNPLPVCRSLLHGGHGGGEGSARHLRDTWVQHALEVGQGGKSANPRAYHMPLNLHTALSFSGN